jgi:hypothetical protein
LNVDILTFLQENVVAYNNWKNLQAHNQAIMCNVVMKARFELDSEFLQAFVIQ